VTNPEVRHEKTPNGGDYSECYYLDRNGNLAKTIAEATEIRILEKKKDGTLVNTVYATVDK
jgi:hypothetical protein